MKSSGLVRSGVRIRIDEIESEDHRNRIDEIESEDHRIRIDEIEDQ